MGESFQGSSPENCQRLGRWRNPFANFRPHTFPSNCLGERQTPTRRPTSQGFFVLMGGLRKHPSCEIETDGNPVAITEPEAHQRIQARKCVAEARKNHRQTSPFSPSRASTSDRPLSANQHFIQRCQKRLCHHFPPHQRQPSQTHPHQNRRSTAIINWLRTNRRRKGKVCWHPVGWILRRKCPGARGVIKSSVLQHSRSTHRDARRRSALRKNHGTHQVEGVATHRPKAGYWPRYK